MKKSVKTMAVTAALAVMIPFSAYAATTSGDSAASGDAKAEQTEKGHRGLGAEKFGRGAIGEEVLGLLKLDEETYRDKLKSGLTLAEIAEEQGVSRDNLKNALTEANNQKVEEQKQRFASNLDAWIDAKPGADRAFGKSGHLTGDADLSAIAEALGLTSDELKTQLKTGKSIADLAADKGVDVQALVESQKTAIEKRVNEALQAGELTQEQADEKLAKAGEKAERIVNGDGWAGGHSRHGAGKPGAAADASE